MGPRKGSRHDPSLASAPSLETTRTRSRRRWCGVLIAALGCQLSACAMGPVPGPGDGDPFGGTSYQGPGVSARFERDADGAPVGPLHWRGVFGNFNLMCATCHVTGLDRGYDAAADRYATTWAEARVGCEACHGPGEAHLAWASEGRAPGGDRGLVALPRRRGGVDEVSVCGPCHSRRQAITARAPALALAPGYAPAAINLAALLEGGGRAGDAAALLEDALARDPESGPLHRALAAFGKTHSCRQKTRCIAARFVARRSKYPKVLARSRALLAARLVLLARSEFPRTLLGLVYAGQDRIADALEHLGRARALMPGDATLERRYRDLERRAGQALADPHE